MNVLIIDSDPGDLLLTKKLVSYHYKTFGCLTEAEALSLIREHTFDVIIIAVQSKKENASIILLRKLLLNSSIPFKAFALAAIPTGLTQEEFIKEGFLAVISKPLSVQQFQSYLNPK